MWFLTRFYTASEAEKMGLVNIVVPVSSHSFHHLAGKTLQSPNSLLYFVQLENLELETVKWCREILRNSPTAIRVLKAALNAVDDGHSGLQVTPILAFYFLFISISVG